MEPRPPKVNRPAPAPYESPQPPSQPQPGSGPAQPRPEPQPQRRPDPRWDVPDTGSYAPPPAPPIEPPYQPYRPRTEPFAGSANSAGPAAYGSSATVPPGAARPPWYDPAGPGAPGMGVQPPASPPPGVRAGSGGGAGWFLRALVAALAVGILLIAAAFAYTRARDDDDDPNEAAVEQTAVRQTEVAELAALRSTPAGTPAPTTPPEPTVTPTAAASPTAAPESAGNSEGGEDGDAEPTAEPDGDSASAPQRVRRPVAEMIPAESDAPNGFIVDAESDGRFSFNDVAASPGMPADAAARLEEWDWREGIFRGFEPPAGTELAPEATNYLYVSIHRFGNQEGAVAALAYFADIKAEAGLNEVEAEPLGDEMRALSSAAPGAAAEVDLYILDGSRVIRIAAFSDAGDPLPDAIALAQQVLGIS